MAMTYTSIVADMPEWAWDESTQFLAQLSTIMELAQDRCYDAVPELEQLKTSVSGNLVAGSPTLSRPADAIFFRSVEVTISGALVLLQRRDRTELVEMYPTTTVQAAPRYYAEQGPSLLRVAPVPDQAYAHTIWYSRKPAYLASGSNETNWLTQYAPQMLRYALMVESAIFKSHDDGLQMALGAFGRSANDVRKRHGLNERDDFKALASPVSVDNQGDFPVSMGARMRAQAGG